MNNMEPIIKVENLGKSYIIGHQREKYVALRDVLTNKARQVASKTKNLFSGGQLIAGNEMEEFWALKDINFEVQQGDRVGIIGRNGAGKSTLLKVLSRITEPTTGRIHMRGRVASLLEVGTGFHPELSGRENIYLNGAILGMSRAEVKKKFEEIVDFAGVEKFLDTPVKRYSSGMYVRLAFAVAAHLEPEILIVDEVLAVGDAEFQKKCLGKMEDVSKNHGRTVLFVSHNMGAVKNLCNKGILLKDGLLSFQANNMDQVIATYITNISTNNNQSKKWNNLDTAPGNENLKLIRASIESNDKSVNLYTLKDDIDIKFEFWSLKVGMNISITIELFTVEHECVFKLTSNKIKTDYKKYTSEIQIPKNFLNDNIYIIDFYFVKDDSIIEYEFKNILQLEVVESSRNSNYHGKWIGVTRPNFNFEIFDLD